MINEKLATQSVAEYLTVLITACGKPNFAIALEAGFPKSNIISMLKNGNTKVPTNRIPALARSLNSNPEEMFRICMSEYDPEGLRVLDFIYGRTPAEDEL